MSESGDEKKQGRRRGNSNEKELATQLVQIQSKRFYIDVKENQRGRFIKLAEVGAGGRRSRILMSLSAAVEFRTRLGEFSELHSQMGPTHGTSDTAAAEAPNSNKRDQDRLIKSETIVKDRKRYYLDLKENQRGRFLRVSMLVSPRGQRTYLAIPAQGLIEFKDHLNDLLERYGTEEEQTQQAAELPDSKSLRAENKTFYFDWGSNARGVFLRINEVRQNRYRTSITVPEKFIHQFRDLMTEFVESGNQGDKLTSQSVKSEHDAAI